MEQVPDELRPSWDRAFPGRLDWEMHALHTKAKNVEIDETFLQRGVLQISFVWPLAESEVMLKAIFPTTFPYTRPLVFLGGDPEEWPDRHVSPLDGNICLLGRDSAQWRPDDDLATLLDAQLEAALHGGGKEDPQGESAEYWWNQRGVVGCYCLVDSDWDLQNAANGMLDLKVLVEPARGDPANPKTPFPRLRAVVTQVRGPDRLVLANWTAPMPTEFEQARTWAVRWQRLDKTFIPKGNDIGAKLGQLRHEHFNGPGAHFAVGHKLGIRPYVFIHPVELTEKRTGDGWIVGLELGLLRNLSAKKGRADQGLRGALIPVLRAGKGDMGARVPAFGVLAGKRVALIGAGALGAPITIELARNGIAELRVLDHDIVEPGNSVRWPLGVTAWGQYKVSALKEHIEHQYPGCSVIPVMHAIGGLLDKSDDEVLGQILDGVDLVIDASVSHAVNRILWERCQKAGLPLVRLGATPNVAGGTVAIHGLGGGCPVCVQCAREDDSIPTPPGSDDPTLIQPPGCGERTFSGADYDLQELSLQAVRISVATLSDPKIKSAVYTLSLQSSEGMHIPPAWAVSPLPPHPQCPCANQRG